ncbi:MAG: hypothetical protein HETSPECPRED_000537 [Heterodermia speciosa]|uniref:CBM-cenC domain-containing protein n=1 Tax=Heterodermia speciosa TaxID=116794 RepID=A0A8H3IRC6_9LECA|nr:MAG: hypothetical protein HETSPECPRED_000537 [Heterodermia speciosa]
MKFSASAVKLSLGASILLCGPIVNAATSCNADNCLRALFPTGTPSAVSSALAFCATYTTTINTATTGFPTRATAGCGTATARYSSACSCKPTATSCPPVVAPNNLVQNGGFECGLPPWTAGDVVNTAHKLSSPGAAGSNTAYEFDQIGQPGPDSSRNPSFLTQSVPGLTVGAAYKLVFSLFFDACTSNTGFVGVRIGSQGGLTYDACDSGQAAVGKFFQYQLPFTADAATESLRFEFIINRPGAVVKIDNVAITPA